LCIREKRRTTGSREGRTAITVGKETALNLNDPFIPPIQREKKRCAREGCCDERGKEPKGQGKEVWAL